MIPLVGERRKNNLQERRKNNLQFSVQPRAAVARAMNSKRWSGYRFFVEEFFGRESWMEFGGVG